MSIHDVALAPDVILGALQEFLDSYGYRTVYCDVDPTVNCSTSQPRKGPNSRVPYLAVQPKNGGCGELIVGVDGPDFAVSWIQYTNGFFSEIGVDLKKLPIVQPDSFEQILRYCLTYDAS